MLRLVNQVVHLVRVVLHVVQLVGFPDAVIVDELVAVGPYPVGRRRVREIGLPIVLVENRVSPRHFLALQQGQDRPAVHVLGRLGARGLQDRRRAMSIFCTSCVTFVPGLMSSGQYASSGTRIEASYTAAYQSSRARRT